MSDQICRICGQTKELSAFFAKGKRKSGQLRYDCTCKNCRRIDQQSHYQANRDRIVARARQYYRNNKETILESRKEYRQDNQCKIADYLDHYYQNNKQDLLEYQVRYYSDNKEQITVRRARYRARNIQTIRASNKRRHQIRRFCDPIFRMRGNVSSLIRQTIKKNGGSKNYSSISQFLPYTIVQLKAHLESRFEPWMTWDNYGKYVFTTWNDHDPATWTWQLDHITPQAELPYTSLTDVNFQKCWSLNNLRPYSAKQNVLDGTSGIRHSGGR
jgi:hypothetical protein